MALTRATQTTRSSLLGKLKQKLNPFISEYETHLKENQKRPALIRPFFDALHYISERHGEYGYHWRKKFLRESEVCQTLESLMETIKKYYRDPNTGDNTRLAIQHACFEEFEITSNMINIIAKNEEKYQIICSSATTADTPSDPLPYDSYIIQQRAKDRIMNYILDKNPINVWDMVTNLDIDRTKKQRYGFM